jgi:hypothetical protein
VNRVPLSRLTSTRPPRGARKALAVGAAALVIGLPLTACSATGTSSVTGTSDGAGAGSTASSSGGTALGTGSTSGTASDVKPGLTLSPATGLTAKTPGYSSPACPSGYQGSGVVREVSRNGSVATFSITSNTVTAPFTGTLYASLTQLQAFAGIPNGGTQQVTIVCYSGPSEEGKQEPAYNVWLTYSADGKSYTTSSTKP